MGAISSAAERIAYIDEVAGSNPALPTKLVWSSNLGAPALEGVFQKFY